MYAHKELHDHLRGWRGHVHVEDGVYTDVYDGTSSILSGKSGIVLFAGVDDNDIIMSLS
jgi:hypothetical protein